MEYPGTGTGSFYFNSGTDPNGNYLSIASKRDGLEYAPDVIEFYAAEPLPLGYFAEYVFQWSNGQSGTAIDYASGGISTAQTFYGNSFL